MYAPVPGEASSWLDAAMSGVVILFAHPILTESSVTLRVPLLLAPLALLAAPLSAQYLREVGSAPAPKTLVGINLQVGVPQGEFKNFVGTGAGLGGNITFFLDRGHRAGLRIWGSWIEYGRSTQRVPLSPTLPGLNVDLTTSNDIFSFGVGPEIDLGSGPLRPYLHAAIGVSDFATTTSVEGTNNSNAFASTTNFNDWTFAWYGGGGLMYLVSRKNNPVYIDAGVRYQGHGQTRYLREGSIQSNGSGGVILNPVESKTDLLIIHLGVQVGI
jgi:hypothetical protein